MQWVMDACRADMVAGARQEDGAQLVDGAEPGSEAVIAPPPTELNVAQSKDEQPLPSLVKPVVDAAAEP